MPKFEALVASWLAANRYTTGPVSNLKVEPHGTDWAGDSENGFYSTFSVDISWDGGYTPVEGEEMESLWRAVMAPTSTQ